MPVYTWVNTKTDEYQEVFNSISEREKPPTDEEGWVRILEMPAHLRKTYLDGQRKDMSDAKKIAKLEVAKAGLRKSDPQVQEINKEIRGRKKI